MRTLRSLLTTLTIACGLLVGPGQTTATDPPPATGAAPVRDHGVELRLMISERAWSAETPPALQLRFVNHGSTGVRVVSPLDGSWDGMRAPSYALELLDEHGTIVPGVLGVSGGRCGLTNPLVPAQDILPLAPDQSVPAQGSPNSFPFYGTVLADARPGTYRARVRYRSDGVPGATPLELVSNTVQVTVRGGNLALWQCQREQQRLAQQQRFVDVQPLDLQAAGDGALALYRADETTVKGDRTRRRGELFLQRIGPAGALGPALALARADGLAHARVAAIDGGALVLYTVDGRVDGAGPETLHALLVRGGDDAWQAAPAKSWGPVATSYSLSLARSGDRLAALYLTRGTGHASALSLQMIDRTGAPSGSPLRLAASAGLDAQLAVEPQTGEFWVAWADAGKVQVRALGVDGRGQSPALALAGEFGSLDALWPHAGGFALAYQRNFTRGDIPDDAMAYYLQRFDAAGGKLGAPELLSPRSRSDPSWGALAWRDRSAARVHVQQRVLPDGRTQDPSNLRFGPLGSDTRVIAGTLLGEPTIAATADGYLVAWSDSRDDQAKSCLRIGACVGELYVASWKRDQTPALAPTRLTRSAVSRPPTAVNGRWRELCE